jgi:SulP family sulfate permease
MWQTRKRDFIVCVGTFVATLLVGVDVGVILGVVLNLLMFMISLAWISIDEVGRNDDAEVYEAQYVPLRHNPAATTWRGVSVIKIEDSLCFINVDVVTQSIEKIGHDAAFRDGIDINTSVFPKTARTSKENAQEEDETVRFSTTDVDNITRWYLT